MAVIQQKLSIELLKPTAGLLSNVVDCADSDAVKVKASHTRYRALGPEPTGDYKSFTRR